MVRASTSGRAEEAEELLRTAAATFEELGDHGRPAAGRCGLLAWTRFQQGHAAEAGEMAEAVLDDDPPAAATAGRSG